MAPSPLSADASSAPAQTSPKKMDRMYRWTRHVYDFTRRYYLLGRDRMLNRIAKRPAGHVLEIGYGTARNLRVLHRKAPLHQLYGLDASHEMLTTARTTLDRADCSGVISLKQGLAEELNPGTQFDVNRPFDVIFFSYVLSMIPSWPTALEKALSHLAPSGRLYIVDFWDQAKLPTPVASLLRQWLSLFDVTPRLDLVRTLQSIDAQGHLSCTITSVARRYAFVASIALKDEDGDFKRASSNLASSAPTSRDLFETIVPGSPPAHSPA